MTNIKGVISVFQLPSLNFGPYWKCNLLDLRTISVQRLYESQFSSVMFGLKMYLPYLAILPVLVLS